MTEQVFVQEGQQILVTNSSVYITDLDTPNAQISINLQMPPEHGNLFTAYTSFSDWPRFTKFGFGVGHDKKMTPIDF